MVDLNPVKVIRSSSGQVAAVAVQFTMFGIVGAGSGDHENEVRGPFTSLAEVLADYPDVVATSGHTGVYRAAYDYFQNGGQQLYICEYELETEVTDTQNGTGAKKEFAITAAAQPEVGTLKVEVNSATLTEGVDYIVDYSNYKVCLKTAPITGTGNVVFKFKETTTAHVEAALASLESVTVNVVCAAYQFNDTMLAKVKDHCVSATSSGKPRICFLNGVYFDVTDILTMATSLDSERVAIFANRCGYYNASLADPSQSWLEFKDYAVAEGGIACSNYPWESLHFKAVKGVNWYNQFSSTDLATLLSHFINVGFDPDWLLGAGIVTNQAWVIDSTRAFQWIDEIRTFDYIDNTIKSVLTTPAFIGHLKINRPPDMGLLKSSLNTISNALYQVGAVYNPALLKDRFGVDPVVLPIYDALLAEQAGSATDVQKSLITNSENSRHANAYFSYREGAAIHTIDVYLTPL